MTKKEYILKLLTALETSWEVAPGLKFLIEKNGLDDETITILTEMFDKVIETTIDEGKKEKLQQGKNFLERLKQMEGKEQEKNEEDIKRLDEILQNI